MLPHPGNGPWGSLTWSYDRIGNRLSEERDGATADSYVYAPNGASGNSPMLDSITLGAGGSKSFTYGPAGHQTQVDAAGNLIDRTYDEAGRLAIQERTAPAVETTFRYDGRRFLRSAESTETVTAGAEDTHLASARIALQPSSPPPLLKEHLVCQSSQR